MGHYDRSTGLVMGESKSKVMYLLMKAKHRYLMEQNDSLSEELSELKAELEREKVEKDSALDELLHRTLGCVVWFYDVANVDSLFQFGIEFHYASPRDGAS